jgi:hypothetical protein
MFVAHSQAILKLITRRLLELMYRSFELATSVNHSKLLALIIAQFVAR